MAQFASDTFAGTTGNTLQTYSASWVLHPSYTSSALIATGRVRGPNDGSSTAYYHTGTPASADYSVSADIYVQTNTSGKPAVFGRLDTTANTGYHARFWAGTGWQLYKVNAGTFTQLGSTVGQTLTVGNTYNLKLEMIGSAIKVYVDGVLTISAVDTSITAAGKAGLSFRDAISASDTTLLHLDNFSADDLATDVTVALTGQLLAAAQGSASVSTSMALSGQSLNWSQWALSPETSKSITGQAVAGSAGSLSPSNAIALLGQAVSVAQGTLGVSGAASVALSGQSLSSLQGSLSRSSNIVLSGQSIASSGGSLSAGNSVALSGSVLTGSQGSVSVSTSVSLSGQSYTVSQGSLSVPGNVTIALVGQSGVLYQGSMTPSSSASVSYSASRTFTVPAEYRIHSIHTG